MAIENKTQAKQIKKFLTGNEAAVEAARAIQFHVMGYYPITPSTEIAQGLEDLRVTGEIQTVLIPADGEHGAAGICFGASTGGARVLNATSANGFLYSLEQLPAQAGARLPMVLNLVTRSVSAPLDIRCDHSDFAYALQTGWILLMASTPQAVYDLNLLAIRLGEHPEVRLPVMVVSDGFFTSHQRQPVDVIADLKVAQDFLGIRVDPYTTLDPRNPVTIGPYMNDPDLINNKKQLHQAHEKSAEVFRSLTREFEALTGRKISEIETYHAEDATDLLILLNSAAETSKDAVDKLRAEGRKVGIIRPVVMRPFPMAALSDLPQSVERVLVAERVDTPGMEGGPLFREIAQAYYGLKKQPILKSRIFGIGGKDFTEADAVSFFDSLADSQSPVHDFFGTVEKRKIPFTERILPPLEKAQVNLGLTAIRTTERNGLVFAEAAVADLGRLTMRPKRIASGHGACPGCGIFSGLDQFFKGIEGDVVALYHTGCAMVVTTDFPFSAHRISYLHNLFQNGAPTLSGLVETFFEKKRRGEIDVSEDITFVMITGDGGMDIGLGPTLGTAFRNHSMIIIEYDNQGYMNTGGQLSYSTPFGHQTVTSQVGGSNFGKRFHHRDTPELMAASGIPYVFTAIESPLRDDLFKKAAKAQWHAKHSGLVFGKLLTACPLNWKSETKVGQEILQMAVDTRFFPLYEVEHGETTITYFPENEKGVRPIQDWLGMMGKTRHLLEAKNETQLKEIQRHIDRKWNRLKARHDHPEL